MNQTLRNNLLLDLDTVLVEALIEIEKLKLIHDTLLEDYELGRNQGVLVILYKYKRNEKIAYIEHDYITSITNRLEELSKIIQQNI